jgi:methanogenic corrinoid protein MtbC1
MAFLRNKTIGGRVYAYLVENRWDSKRSQSRQYVVRYLGRLDRLKADAIPEEYRTPAIVEELERRVQEERDRRSAIAQVLRGRLGELLRDGDRSAARKLARAAVRRLGAGTFLTEVVTAVMHDIGDRWEAGGLSVSDEHLVTGLVADLVAELNRTLDKGTRNGHEVVLCVPEGEDHTLALLAAEGLLRSKGYVAVNIGGSAPLGSVAEFVRERHPGTLLISVTQLTRLDSATDLARRVRRGSPDVRVAIGGQAVEHARTPKAVHGVELVRGSIADFIERLPPADVAV